MKKSLFVLMVMLLPSLAWAVALDVTIPNAPANALADSMAQSEGVTLSSNAERKTYLENKIKAWLKSEYTQRIEFPTREATAKTDANTATTTAFGG